MEASEFKRRFLPLSRRMYWAAWRLTENREEAEDLVQDVFLRLWTQRSTLTDIANAEAYCVRLVQRRFLDLHRVRHPEASLPSDISLLPSGDDLYHEAELRDHALLARASSTNCQRISDASSPSATSRTGPTTKYPRRQGSHK